MFKTYIHIQRDSQAGRDPVSSKFFFSSSEVDMYIGMENREMNSIHILSS